ncbi:MAG: hypothetical protein ABI600_08525 [Luteolibacter sp.]
MPISGGFNGGTGVGSSLKVTITTSRLPQLCGDESLKVPKPAHAHRTAVVGKCVISRSTFAPLVAVPTTNSSPASRFEAVAKSPVFRRSHSMSEYGKRLEPARFHSGGQGPGACLQIPAGVCLF